ncbi:hypothetical protein StoSoilB19_17540 [Arthrobacter sp. StoSoilB19]|nr:hypothetical protein StoSoilB19_17540 [Arthrobacter sp. StoSoilB19]
MNDSDGVRSEVDKVHRTGPRVSAAATAKAAYLPAVPADGKRRGVRVAGGSAVEPEGKPVPVCRVWLDMADLTGRRRSGG